MPIHVYIASLIFGGVLLGASILLGGSDDIDSDIDLDHDLDLEADLDIEMDLDGDVDLDVDAHVDIDTDALDHASAANALLWPLRSVRFWTFFTAFFGLTGVALQGLGLMGLVPTLLTAIAMGTSTGYVASWVFRRLLTDTTARVGDSQDFVGKSAKILVPMKKGGVGKVRVEVRGQLVDVLATSADGDLSAEDEVIVIEMDGMRARIAKLSS